MKPKLLSGLRAILFATPSLFMCSCGTVLYSTVGQNVPLFKKKGEVSISGALGITQATSGVAAQLAVAATDRTAIIFSYNNLQDGGSSVSHANYVELGGGRFWGVPSEQMVAEVFGGIGFGQIHNGLGYHNNGGKSGTLDISFMKPFVQPSIGVSGRFGEVAFTPRVALVHYLSQSSDRAIPELQSLVDSFYHANENTLVFEPGVTLRLGVQAVKLQMQLNYSTFPATPNSSDQFVSKTFLSIGLNVLINKRR